MTPRTGDRVLVSAGPIPDAGVPLISSTCGVVASYDSSHVYPYRVQLDLVVGPSTWQHIWRFPADRLTVLDRTAAAWPTYVSHGAISAKWTNHDGIGPYFATVADTAEDARRNADAWTFVADHWDELRGQT